MSFKPTFRNRQAINDVWDKLTRAYNPGLQGMDFYSSLVNEVTETQIIFCDPTGDDNNPGTLERPFRQPQAAFDSLPSKLIRASIKVKCAPGTYAGCVVEGFYVLPAPSFVTDTSYLHLEGTMSDVTAADLTPASGVLTAWVAASGQVFTVATDTSKTFTVNEFEGKFLQITSGTGSTGTINTPNMWLITGNTTNTITVVGPGVTNAAAASGYKVISPGTFFTTGTAPTSGINNPASIAQFFGPTGIVFTQNLGVSFAVSNCEFTLGTAMSRGITTGEQRVRIFCSRFIGGTGAANSVISNASTGLNAAPLLFEVFSSHTASVAHVGYSTGGGSTSLPCPALTGVYLKGGLIGLQMGGTAAGAAVSGCLFKNQTLAGIQAVAAVPQGQIVNSRFDTCVTGILCSEASTSGLGMVSLGLNSVDISNCTSSGISLVGAFMSVDLSGVTGSNNGTGLNITRGARAVVAANVTLTGNTAEVQIDATVSNYTTMRGLTPKLVRDTNYGTSFYQ